MSIAVSALVGPSRVHRSLLAACALVQLTTAAFLALPWAGDYLGTPLLALSALLGAAALARAASADAHPPKTHRIDISGTGELRVTVQQGMQAARLLPGSVVWPLLMVLRCRLASGQVRVLIVWRDAVDGATWRALAVALRVIGREKY
jgi:toxin CptA